MDSLTVLLQANKLCREAAAISGRRLFQFADNEPNMRKGIQGNGRKNG